MRITTQLIMVTLLFRGCNSYFSYRDCPGECRLSNKCCLIHGDGEGNFDYECFETRSDCEDLADNWNACVKKDDPTVGGSSFWKDFEKHKHQPKPEPKPAVCKEWIWKILSLIQLTVSLLMIGIYVSLKITTVFRRRTYNMLTNTSPDNPYQTTVENINPEINEIPQ